MHQRGQATLEYVAILGVVAVLLVLAGASTAAPSIVNAVGHGFQRALCLLTHSGCATVDKRPCTVRTTNTGAEVTAKIAFVRIGAQAGLLRAERSDGSVSLTLLEHLEAGLTAGVGEDGHLRIGSIDVGEGVVAQVQAVARLGGGRSWNLDDGAAADALTHRLVQVLAGEVVSGVPVIGAVLQTAQQLLDIGDGVKLPPAASRILDARAGLKASLTLQGGTGLSAGLGAVVGLTEDIATGRHTLLLRLEGDGAAALANGLGGLSGEGSVSLDVTYDRSGRPVELSVSQRGHGKGSAGTLPAAISAQLARGVSATTSAVLDLTEPAGAQAVARVLRALSGMHPGELVSAARALGSVLGDDGRHEVQRYGVRESGYGAGGEVGVGPQIGVDAEVTRATSELLDAWTRPPGGVWERRIDCLAS